MSPKELLYIDDALGHEQQIKACCNEAVNQLEDNDLKTFVSDLCQRHTQAFNRFYNLLS